MVITADDALTQFIIFVGVAVGVTAWTLWQYLKAQDKFKDFDISIVFDKKFVGTAIGAFITAFVLVAGSFNVFLAQVIALGPMTYVTAFFYALGIGFTFNAAANQFIPSPANPNAERILREREAAKLLTERGIDLEKLSGSRFEDGALGRDSGV